MYSRWALIALSLVVTSAASAQQYLLMTEPAFDAFGKGGPSVKMRSGGLNNSTGLDRSRPESSTSIRYPGSSSAARSQVHRALRLGLLRGNRACRRGLYLRCIVPGCQLYHDRMLRETSRVETGPAYRTGRKGEA